MPEICGKPTRKGTPCQLPKNCPVHLHCNLSARNAKVRASFAAHHPEAYAAHQVHAAKRGFAATADKHGASRATEKAREYRLAHPSEPERWAMAVLGQAQLNHFSREYPVLDGNYSVDFAWPDARRAIEIDGHPSRADATEETRRAERQALKAQQLTADGWQLLVIDATRDRAAGAQSIIEFARAAQPAAPDPEISF